MTIKPSENAAAVEAAAGALLANEQQPSPARIREIIGRMLLAYPGALDEESAEALARRFEARHGVTMAVGAMLHDDGYVPWLQAAKTRIDPYYWDRYRRLLGSDGFSGQVIATLDDVTDRVLGLLEDPSRSGPWDRRGMVVGHVQSGKTANYIGLMCKAADAGYRLIVVIAGVHNNLRNQTQVRVDEGFVGRDSARLLNQHAEQVVGVGRFDGKRRPVTFTNSVQDFRKSLATSVGVPLQNLNEPAVFVIKKNSSTLQNLLDWLREYSTLGSATTIDTPMLLIDDEADNASINIRHGQQEVARINGQIRSLLNMFSRSCYIGYTATPFANIFIDPATDDQMFKMDLFPRNFVVSLDPPTDYFGPQKVFIDEPEKIVRHIGDSEDLLPLRHGIDFKVTSLPPSLVEAIRTFVLARAIRLARGQTGQHSSMLVNASRFTGIQGQLRNEIHEKLASIQRSIRIFGAGAADAMSDPELIALRATWATEYAGMAEDWATVFAHLHEAAQPIIVVEINARSRGALNYSDHKTTGLNVIAVGGFSLSRGLTLEGLVVSYFLRNSMMYDTLMQMARWFGYRAGYEDLCRVWMPEDAADWYAHIAESTEMLRDDIRAMERVGGTPQDFGLKVRSHPASLMVVARNKMGAGERTVVQVGLGNQFIETATLLRGKHLGANREAAGRLGGALADLGMLPGRAEAVSGGWLVRSVPVDPIRSFLAAFRNDPRSILTDTEPVLRYIDARSRGELERWDVLLASVARDETGPFRDEAMFRLPINSQRRTASSRTDAKSLLVSSRQRVASRGIERIGLSPRQRADAEAAYRESVENGGSRGGAVNYPDRIYRAERTAPLLIIHLLRIEGVPDAEDLNAPVIAWGISFPPSRVFEERVEYVVNATWLTENETYFGYDAPADDDDDDA